MTAYEMKRFHERKHMNESYEDCLLVWHKPFRTSGNDYLYLCYAEDDRGPWGESFDWSDKDEALPLTRTRAQEYADRFNAWAKTKDPNSQFIIREK